MALWKLNYYAPPLIGGGIKRCFYLTSVCLSVAYIGPKSRTERPRKTKIGTEIAHVARESDSTLKIKRSKRVRLLQRSACERIRRGKVLLRCVCSAAREALGRPRGRRGAEAYIVSPRAQLVIFIIITVRKCIRSVKKLSAGYYVLMVVI